MIEHPNTLVFADFSQCAPSSALSRARKKGCWRLVDYETEEGVEGTMVFAYPNESTPALNFTIEARGTYRVLVGINYTRVPGGDHLLHSPWPVYGQQQLKFEEDPGFTRFALEIGWKLDAGWKLKSGWEDITPGSSVGKSMQIYTSIQETFWKVREFDGVARLTVAGMESPYSDVAGSRIANVAYVKLVPVTGHESGEWRRLRPQPSTRRMAALWCPGMLTGHAIGSPVYHPTSIDWFRDEMAPFVDSDVGVFVFECIRGNLCAFRTRLGDVGPEDNAWDPSWVDPLACFRDLAHENGMKCFAAMRMMGRGLPMVDEPIGRARFVVDHPQWARLGPDGAPTNNVSLAFPEVRAHWLGLLRETLDYGIDGVMIYFHRAQPFVLFEEPVVESFREEYGEDLRKLPMDDPRAQRHRAGYVTTFLREVRALVDEKPGRQLAVSVYGIPYKFDQVEHFDPIRYNCDVDTWIQEKLVDYLMPTPTVDYGMIRRWRDLGGEKFHIWPDLQPRLLPGEASVSQTREFYEAGADGISLWDAERRPPHVSYWAVMRALGHRDDLDLLQGKAAGLHRRVPLRTLSGYSVPFSYKDG